MNVLNKIHDMIGNKYTERERRIAVKKAILNDLF